MTFAKEIKYQFAVFYTDIIRVNEKETNKNIWGKKEKCINVHRSDSFPK